MTVRPILNVWGAEHSYGVRKILRGVDLTVRPGEIYVLAGPDGAGKSTLIGAICGRFRLAVGEVALDGENPVTHPAARARLGLAPEEDGLFERLTLRENLEVFGRLAGAPRRELADTVARAMRLTRTTDGQDVPVRRLPAGHRRRANIAAAILHEPRLVVIDEPAAGLDAESRETLDAVIRDLRDDRRAVLVVTRDLDQAGGLADRVGFLRDGRIALEGEPRSLIAQAFGHEMEIVVLLDGEPGPEGERILAGEGLEPRGRFAWARLEANAYAAAGDLDRRLRARGLAPREVRVREPSLLNLFSLVADWSRAA